MTQTINPEVIKRGANDYWASAAAWRDEAKSIAACETLRASGIACGVVKTGDLHTVRVYPDWQVKRSRQILGLRPR